MGGNLPLVPLPHPGPGMRDSRLDRTTPVAANGKVARSWRVRRIKAVLGKRDKAEMAALLRRWDRYLATNGQES
jgi:hypothetical protein